MVSIRAANLPDAPLDLANNPLVTSAGLIGLTWSQGVYNGGSPVIDYRVSIMFGTNTYTVLASNVVQAFYSVSSLTPHTLYTFTVEERTLVGYSPFSV